jgi:hypothetical protein
MSIESGLCDSWIFKGSCFGYETLKNIAWNAVKDYFMNIKVSLLYTIHVQRRKLIPNLDIYISSAKDGQK